MAAPMPGIVTTWTWGEAGSSAKALVNNVRIAVSARWQCRSWATSSPTRVSATAPAQRRDRFSGGLVQRLGGLGGAMGDLLQGSEVGRGDPLGRGILVEEPQDPTGGDVVGQGSELGEGACQEVVQSVDGLGRLFDLGLQAAGDLAQQDHGRGGSRRGVGLFDDGEAGHGLALGVVGGALGEMGLLVILVAFGLADGEGHGQVEAAEELFEIGGVLAGSIDAHVKVSVRMMFM